MSAFSIDALGQHPFLHKLYTQICCIFPVSDQASQDDIVGTLRYGLEKLSKSFPWIAGDVIYDSQSDSFKIVPVEKIPLDLRGDSLTPSMKDLRDAGFPCKMLDERSIAPCLTINLPGTTEGLAAFSAPVFAVQANFITGGLLLTIVTQHNVTDMTGQDHIVSLLSKACHNEPFTEEDLAIGMMDRSSVIPLLESDYDIWNPGPELDYHVQKTNATKEPTDVPDVPASNVTWAYVNFSPESLGQLKSLAVATKDSSIPFVSTDDTVCAFLWKHVSRARLARLNPTIESMMSRAVDLRERMGVHSSYLGMLQSLTFAKQSLQKLADEPLGVTASHLRSLLNPEVVDLVYQARAFSTYVARAGEKKIEASFTANMNPSSDLMTSSWSKTRYYDYDFNLGLGRPEAVRRPKFPSFECLVYLMPRCPSGELSVQICLRDEDWDCLMADEEFARYAKYIG